MSYLYEIHWNELLLLGWNREGSSLSGMKVFLRVREVTCASLHAHSFLFLCLPSLLDFVFCSRFPPFRLILLFRFFSHFRLFIFVSLPLAWFFSLVSLPLTWFISRFPPFSLNFLPRFPTFSLFFSLSVSPLSLKSVTAFPCDFPSFACYRLLFPLRVHIRQIHV